MFLPIGDEPNAKETPWATYGLIGTNVLVWLWICRPATQMGVDPTDPNVLHYLAIMGRALRVHPRALLHDVTAYDVLTFTYGFRPAAPSLVALFASLFMHAGWLHLLGNMLFLYIFGDNVEARLGWRRYVALYFGAGVVATLFYALCRWGSELPLIGASGAISGILGAYFVWFPGNRVRIVMVLIIFIQIIYLPARLVLGFYLLVENLLPFLFDSPGTGSTAYGAHVGGFLAGALVGLGFDHWRATGSLGSLIDWLRLARGKRPAWGAQASGDAPCAAKDAVRAHDLVDAMAQGRTGAAYAAYQALTPDIRAQLSAAQCFALADALTMEKDFALASVVLGRYLAEHPAGSRAELARAHLRLGLLQLRGLNRPAAAREHLLSVMDLWPDSDESQVAKEALAAC